MPKRKKLSQIIFSGELPETSGEKRQGLFRRLTSRFTGGHVVRSTRFAAAPAPAASAPLPVTLSLDERLKSTAETSVTFDAASGRMSVGPSVARPTIDELSAQFTKQASVTVAVGPSVDQLPALIARPTGPNPASLAEPHVVGPVRGRSSGSVVVLHGFTCNGPELADELIPPLIEQFPRARQVRFVFLTAPTRSISCYGEPQELNGWHDYFTDHGGAEGRPDIEEEIDVGQLEWSAAQVHKVMDAEAALLGDDDLSRVALLGQSQGSCTSLHCALTHPKPPAGWFGSIGQLYSHTPVPSDRKEMPMFMFNGAADDCIACSLSLRTYSRLLDAGYKKVRMHVAPDVGHQGCTEPETALLGEALEAWGMLSGPATPRTPRSPGIQG